MVAVGKFDEVSGNEAEVGRRCGVAPRGDEGMEVGIVLSDCCGPQSRRVTSEIPMQRDRLNFG